MCRVEVCVGSWNLDLRAQALGVGCRLTSCLKRHPIPALKGQDLGMSWLVPFPSSKVLALNTKPYCSENGLQALTPS